MDVDVQLREWYPLLSHCFEQEWMLKLGRRLSYAKNNGGITPPLDKIFQAFTLCQPRNLKVVIIGQDPYIRGEADGLAFSSKYSMTPSLEIIFQEIDRTEPMQRTVTGLYDWAKQGVLLLNSVLTTKPGLSRAHHGWGWELFVKEVLAAIQKLPQPVVFMLWGGDARIVARSVWDSKKRFILHACHPVAQSRGIDQFVGCRHFWFANRFLVINGIDPIWWGDPQLRDEEIYNKFLRALINDYKYADTSYAKKLHMPDGVGQRWREDERFGLESRYEDDLPF